jgi:hypothetical protein
MWDLGYIEGRNIATTNARVVPSIACLDSTLRSSFSGHRACSAGSSNVEQSEGYAGKGAGRTPLATAAAVGVRARRGGNRVVDRLSSYLHDIGRSTTSLTATARSQISSACAKGFLRT